MIVEFIRRKLRVGGVLYISYNTLPGWAAFAPMRHLMTEHAEVIGAEGRGIVSRINDAIEFADKLLATNPMFSRANPQVAERIKKLKDQNRHYLAHEYFNRDWHPMHFATMAEWLEPAKVQFACSAHYLDQIEALNLTADQQAFLKEIPDAMFRQSVRDFMVNQQFRKDYWVKGARRLGGLEQLEALRAERLILTTPRADVSLKINGALGEASMSEAVYNPILDAMADYKIKTIGQLEQQVSGKDISLTQLYQAIMVLAGAGHLASAQTDQQIDRAKKQCDKINDHIVHKARSSGEISYLASPVTGGGFAIGRFPQLFLLALGQGKKQPADLANFVWTILAAQGQRIQKEGKVIESPDENLAELTSQAKTFMDKQLPILKALRLTA